MTDPGTTGFQGFWQDFRAGTLAILPLLISIAAYGLLWGALAAGQGLSPLETLIMSALIFAGGAQFVILDLWTTPPAIWLVTAAALVVNLRFVLMGAAMVRPIAHWPSLQSYAALYIMADENWALALKRAAEAPLTIGYYLGLSGSIYLTWIVVTPLGNILGTGLEDPERWGLDFAFAAVFLVLLTGLWKGPRRSLLPWMAAGVAAVAGEAWLPGAWYILTGALTGTLVGVLQGESLRIKGEGRDVA